MHVPVVTGDTRRKSARENTQNLAVFCCANVLAFLIAKEWYVSSENARLATSYNHTAPSIFKSSCHKGTVHPI